MLLKMYFVRDEDDISEEEDGRSSHGRRDYGGREIEVGNCTKGDGGVREKEGI